MSHHIYTTPGFIVKSHSDKESGKFFLIFTRDLGMIGATAQGVRLSSSKLRYHIQDYSCGLFSFVRGKEVWRVTGANEFCQERISQKENKKLFIKILFLLKRLVPGEEKNEKLFECIEKFHGFLMDDKGAGALVEIVTVLRILYYLGYVSNQEPFSKMLSHDNLNEDIFKEVAKHKALIIKEINNALKESQL